MCRRQMRWSSCGTSLGCTIADRAIEALRADHGLTLGDLDRISCPVLLATPQYDRVLPPQRHTARYRREIPGVEPVELAGCGHVPMWDDTPLVLRTIVEFVDRHTSSAGDTAQAAQVTPLASTPAAG